MSAIFSFPWFQIFSGEVQRYNCDDSVVTANSRSAEPRSTQLYQFSFADKKSENIESQENIKSYIKNFERGSKRDFDSEATRSYYDAGEYIRQGHNESVFIDRLQYKSRIESGGLLLCGGAISFLPFAPVMWLENEKRYERSFYTMSLFFFFVRVGSMAIISKCISVLYI